MPCQSPSALLDRPHRLSVDPPLPLADPLLLSLAHRRRARMMISPLRLPLPPRFGTLASLQRSLRLLIFRLCLPHRPCFHLNVQHTPPSFPKLQFSQPASTRSGSSALTSNARKVDASGSKGWNRADCSKGRCAELPATPNTLPLLVLPLAERPFRPFDAALFAPPSHHTKTLSQLTQLWRQFRMMRDAWPTTGCPTSLRTA